MTPRSLFRLVLAFLPAGLLSAQASVFRGPAGGPGDVWNYPTLGSAGSQPGELQGIVLLPVDATGRSALTQFQPDQPRLRPDVPFASRLVLPHGQGSLYRYRRANGHALEFGFFVVRPDGLAAFLVAFPGAGPSGNDDPTPNPVGISPQGDAMLVATTVAAGGDVYLVEFATAKVHALTAGVPPVNVLPQGLTLLSTWGAVLTDRGPLRFLRSGGQVVAVPLRARSGASSLGHNPGAPATSALTYFGQGMAASADGSTIAAIAGTSSAAAHIFTFGPAGASVCVNDTPAPIADPGYGTSGGPTLALSPDGKRAAWKTQTVGPTASGECFTRKVPVTVTPPEEQITGDLNFADTLNDTGVIAFFDPNSVVLLVGETNGVAGIEKADLFRTTFPLGGGAPQFTNLTNTSGDTSVPFLSKGTLDSSDGIYQIPGQSGMLYYVSGSSGQGELRRVDAGGTNALLIRSGVAALDLIEAAGANFVLGIEHDAPAQRELLSIPFDPAKPVKSLAKFAVTQLFLGHAGNAAGLFGVGLTTSGGYALGQVQLPNGPMNALSGAMVPGTTMGFDGAGSLLTTLADTQRAFFVGWSLSTGVGLYGSGPAGSFVLPAN